MPVKMTIDERREREERATRLREARTKAGYAGPTAAAKRFGWNPETYKAHESGRNGFGLSDARRYAKAFNVDLSNLNLGEQDAPRAQNRVDGFIGKWHTIDEGDEALPAVPRAIKVYEADVRLGGGAMGTDPVPVVVTTSTGIQVSADYVRDEWGIPESFLRGQLRVPLTSAQVMEVFGDSGYDPDNPNAPGSLFPGDRVIIDLSDRRPSPPGLFALYDGVGIVVKMVEIVRGAEPARLRLKSRNPGYSPYEATEDEAQIIGRIRGRISAL